MIRPDISVPVRCQCDHLRLHEIAVCSPNTLLLMRHPHIFWVPLTISRPKDSSDIFAAHGFNSATKIHELAEEIQADNRHYAFFYVGDYDPSGMYMSEVDLNDR